MLRTANTPLRAVWALAYWSVMRAAVAYMRRRYHDASVYLKGSFAAREPVYGISDIDLVVVVPGDGSERGSVQQRMRLSWTGVSRGLSVFRFVLQHCWIYEEDDLRESLSAPCLTYGLESDGQDDDRAAVPSVKPRRAAFLGAQALRDHMGLQTHPSLYGARREWRRLGGRDRLPSAAPDDPQGRRIAAWLHLQYWWRYAFQACTEPDRAHIPLLCVKLLAEPVRLWLWVARGERVETRETALRRGLSELPTERETLELGLELLRALPRSPRPPLAAVIGGLLRHSERLARHMRDAAEAAGFTDVRLVKGDGLEKKTEISQRSSDGLPVPLLDWRALAVPSLADESMMLFPRDAADPAVLAAMARADGGDPIPALRYDDMLILPTSNPERGMLRAIQCQPTDPVSTALVDARTIARFPELDGWSAIHCARRAVAEHRAWLATDGVAYPPHGWVGQQTGSSESTTRTLGLLFTAARAGLFLESVEEGEPELAVNVAATAGRLVARDSGCRDAVESALGAFRDACDGEDRPVPVTPLREVVRHLPAYTGAPAFSRAAR